MKQLKISYAFWDQHENLVNQGTYITTCQDLLDPTILTTALKVLRNSAKKDGKYYSILDITFGNEETAL